MTYGGSLSTREQIVMAFESGVDRIVLKYGSRDILQLAEWTAQRYGSQAVVMCINYIESNEKQKRNNQFVSESKVLEAIRLIENSNIGEVLLQNVSRSGSLGGLGYSKSWISEIGLPVVVGGGVGSLRDIELAISNGFAGVAVSTLFSLDSASGSPLTSYIDAAERSNLHR